MDGCEPKVDDGDEGVLLRDDHAAGDGETVMAQSRRLSHQPKVGKTSIRGRFVHVVFRPEPCMKMENLRRTGQNRDDKEAEASASPSLTYQTVRTTVAGIRFDPSRNIPQGFPTSPEVDVRTSLALTKLESGEG